MWPIWYKDQDDEGVCGVMKDGFRRYQVHKYGVLQSKIYNTAKGAHADLLKWLKQTNYCVLQKDDKRLNLI